MDRFEYLAHGVGLDVGLLTVAQRHGCDRKGASHHHYQHHDIYDRVDVALLVYLHDRTEVLARRSRRDTLACTTQ